MRHPELVLYEMVDGIATLTFNRPDRLNGMTGNMELAYYERLLHADADDMVKAIVVTGAGKGWCPGADLAYEPGPDDLPMPNEVLPNSTPLAIRKPIIAAINGACAGAGFGLAMMCDFRIAAAGAKFTTAFSQRGLVAEYGVAWHLTQIAGRAVAIDLLMTARVVLAEEMADLGLVNKVVSPDQVLPESMAVARHLAENVSPASMATIKHQVLLESQMSAEEALAHSNSLMYESLRGGDVGEGVLSFLEKRQANFASLGDGTVFEWMREQKD
jgi:enoyl-CoA hydratase/carnithine racemase